MKKTSTLLLLVVLISGFAVKQSKAQFSSGDMILGGDINFSTSSSESTTGTTTRDKGGTTSFEIAPRGGYFVSDNLAVGLGIGFKSRSSESPQFDPNTGETSLETDGESSEFNLNPFARYYSSFSDKAGLFVDGGFTFGFGSEWGSMGRGTEDNQASTSNFSIGVSPGGFVMLGDKFSLEAKVGFIGYNSSTTKWTNKTEGNDFNDDGDFDDPGETSPSETDREEKSNSFDFDIGLSNVFLGMSFYL
ncbi:MAG: outer membrane beta-barrel protein [Flavobacteriales bacterium]